MNDWGRRERPPRYDGRRELERPDPDSLIARARQEDEQARRGKLKILLGAAAGVGKTYAMLEAARALHAAGVDVVAGYVETHGRPETEVLLKGLPSLLRRSVEYRGTTLEEFDLDAALARRPAVILVDELAHTNTPGSRHAKRWQDVVELLEAGLDVYTTVNVQHVESLNDVVANITGVVTRETVPDSIFEQAEDVELIDLPVDDLLQRLRDGKVYLPAQARAAREHFFRKGNLIALRELALRRTADRVDQQMRVYRSQHAVETVWPAAERMLVCVGPAPWSSRLVRAAKRMADRLGAEWIAAHVETPAQLRLSQTARDGVVQTLRLADSLGAQTITLSGQTVGETILGYAHDRNVSKIVVGKPSRRPWRRWLVGSLVDALVRGSRDIDVYVIAREDRAMPPTVLPRPLPMQWRKYAVAGGAVALATAVAWLLLPLSELSDLVMVYLLAIILVAMRTGPGPSLLTSIASALSFDFFFVPPYLSFRVDDVRHALTLTVMLFVGLVISHLTVKTRAQAEAAIDRERRTGALYAMSRDLAKTRGHEPLGDIAIRHVSEVFASRVALLQPAVIGLVAAAGSQFEIDQNELGVARWVFEHREPAGLGTATLPGASALYMPLLGSTGVVGVLGVRPPHPHALDEPERLHQLETFAAQTALALERARLADEARPAQLRAMTSVPSQRPTSGL